MTNLIDVAQYNSAVIKAFSILWRHFIAQVTDRTCCAQLPKNLGKFIAQELAQDIGQVVLRNILLKFLARVSLALGQGNQIWLPCFRVCPQSTPYRYLRRHSHIYAIPTISNNVGVLFLTKISIFLDLWFSMLCCRPW